jgi:hypothetical protein
MADSGTLLDLHIDHEASKMAEYDGWGTHDGHRVNVYRNITAGETITVKIVSFEGGSYFTEAPNKRAKNRSASDDNIRGSKNDLLNSDL